MFVTPARRKNKTALTGNRYTVFTLDYHIGYCIFRKKSMLPTGFVKTEIHAGRSADFRW